MNLPIIERLEGAKGHAAIAEMTEVSYLVYMDKWHPIETTEKRYSRCVVRTLAEAQDAAKKYLQEDAS